MIHLFRAIAGAAVLAACATPAPLPEVAPALPDTPYDYTPALPAHVEASLGGGVDNTPPDNPITDDGATLGRVLFYDTLLSQNGTVSCASCHRATAGFADSVALSAGFEGGHTARNSMSTINVRFYERGRMFWDERAATVEDQVLRPIQDTVEMGLDLDELVARVSEASYYPPLFAAAFGDDAVTTDRIARALAQFVRSIVSYQARWDEGVAQVASIADDFPNYTAEENRGKAIFFGQHDPATRGLCGSCHMRLNPLAALPPGPGPQPPRINIAFFQPVGPTDNGLPALDGDRGVGDVTGLAPDVGAFKPSSLRNLELTAPYMHDGRFATLEEVVRFYDEGVTATPNLHPALRDAAGAPLRLGLSDADEAALVAFLRTLTDPTLADEPRFADPFAR